MENLNCNGSGPHAAGEVRVMPMGNEPMHGNLILCRSCWQHEIEWRRQRNIGLGDFAKFDLPQWDSAPIYGDDPAPSTPPAAPPKRWPPAADELGH